MKEKTEGLPFSCCVLGKVTDNLGCLYTNGDMITPKQEKVVCFVLTLNGIKDAPFVLVQFINGVNGIGMSV